VLAAATGRALAQDSEARPFVVRLVEVINGCVDQGHPNRRRHHHR
jgi:hypothetical protein